MDKFIIIKLLSDQTRFNIFRTLLDFDRLCVSEIENLLGTKQANTSKHLKKLRENSVIEFNREGSVVYYNVSQEFLSDHEDLIRYLLL